MIFDTEKCCGCRSCEMACSYHHKRLFQPAISSIQILDTEDELGFRIFIAEEDTANHIACDGCKGLDEPLCVKYCSEKEELLQRILKVGKR